MRVVKYFYKEYYGRVYVVGICDDNGVTAFSRYLDQEPYLNVDIFKKDNIMEVFKKDKKAVEFIEKNWDKLFKGTIESKIKEKEEKIEEHKNSIKYLKRSIAKLKAKYIKRGGEKDD